jgi:hypothetical protein
MSTKRIAAEARFILSNPDVAPLDVWEHLAEPLQKRYKSWHPSYGEFEPVATHMDGTPWEFVLTGSAGGRYPLRVDEFNPTKMRLRAWRGPSQNPPKGHKETFVGLVYVFQVVPSRPVIIDIKYMEEWLAGGLFASSPSFVDGPKREIDWIFEKFAFAGTVDYIRECEPSQV